MGAAIAAGLAVGVWDSIDELKDVNIEGSSVFKPAMSKQESDQQFARWQKAVEMSRGWAN
ncbi:Glycerol kinase [Aspergillus sclerotialis]|uniref:Glycerol kinase n=1 Tax=Aspergillus sclerotialis TaxID=2070753 RepID=A0A3A2ZHR0_9EURO|nr:Glycerol kinase [Aspergillus sclerotialis]